MLTLAESERERVRNREESVAYNEGERKMEGGVRTRTGVLSLQCFSITFPADTKLSFVLYESGPSDFFSSPSGPCVLTNASHFKSTF